MFGSSVTAINPIGTDVADVQPNCGHIFDRMAQPSFPR
jgi:hypothetical protein